MSERPLLDAMPRFTLERGGIRYDGPPGFVTSDMTDDELVEWRTHLRQQRDRQAILNERIRQHCVCQWRTTTNGDPYEDERQRVDVSTCPVHGNADG